MPLPFMGLFNWSVIAVDQAINHLTYGWLQYTVHQLADRSRHYCKAHQANILVNIVPTAFMNSDRAYVTIYQTGGEPPHPFIEQWAFDYTFTPPVGGYVAPKPPGYFVFHTPQGIKHVKKSYTRKQGLQHREGYFDKAAREIFTKAHLDSYSAPLASLIGTSVVERIRILAERNGATVVVI